MYYKRSIEKNLFAFNTEYTKILLARCVIGEAFISSVTGGQEIVVIIAKY
jgi:hypothetical protein